MPKPSRPGIGRIRITLDCFRDTTLDGWFTAPAREARIEEIAEIRRRVERHDALLAMVGDLLDYAEHGACCPATFYAIPEKDRKPCDCGLLGCAREAKALLAEEDA